MIRRRRHTTSTSACSSSSEHSAYRVYVGQCATLFLVSGNQVVVCFVLVDEFDEVFDGLRDWLSLQIALASQLLHRNLQLIQPRLFPFVNHLDS